MQLLFWQSATRRSTPRSSRSAWHNAYNAFCMWMNCFLTRRLTVHLSSEVPCVARESLINLSAQGLRAALEATMRIKGLLEMMFDKLSGWIDEFITDMEARLCRTCASHVLDIAQAVLQQSCNITKG